MRSSAGWLTRDWSAGITAALTWGNGLGGWWWLGIAGDGCACGDGGGLHDHNVSSIGERLAGQDRIKLYGIIGSDPWGER